MRPGCVLGRRAALLGILGLAGCGFAPVYGPGGAAGRLQGAVSLPEPDTRNAFTFTQRIEERLGRAGPSAPYALRYELETEANGLGATSTGSTTRFRLVGTLRYSLHDASAEAPVDAPVASGTTTTFTGYSTTGTTVSTFAAERDANARLMTILADQMVDRLLLDAPNLPT